MNGDIKATIKAAGLHQWQVAKACGVNESTFVRWLRDELTEERRNMILKAVDDLKGAS